jgi:hypothetical protein
MKLIFRIYRNGDWYTHEVIIDKYQANQFIDIKSHHDLRSGRCYERLY